MWRKHQNNDTLVTTTHKEPEEAADGTNTQVKYQMNDKCKVKMIWKELYNVKNPLWKGGVEKIIEKEEKKLINNGIWKR